MKEQLQILIDKFIPNERKEAYADFARENGFDFRRRASLSRQEFGLRGFKIIQSKYWNELIGIVTKEIPELNSVIRIYDYQSSTNGGHHTTTIIEIKCNSLDLDKFIIHPKSRIKKLKSLLVDPDNDFHEYYSIESTDPEFIIDDIGEANLTLINNYKKLRIEGEGQFILIYMKYKKIKIYELKEYYRFALSFLDNLLTEDPQADFV